MFNLGPEKILVILAIALIVLGPDKLPEAARKAGQVLGNLRRLSGGFENEIRQALDEPMQAFHREFTASTESAPAETVAVGAPTTNGASGDTSTSTADPETSIDESGAAEPETVADPTPAEVAPAAPTPPADAATPEERVDHESPDRAADEPSSPAPAADQPPASPPVDEAAGAASTPSLPGWVFGRDGEDSGPAFH